MPMRVLVLFGGRSAEHEISILSARFIVRSLDRARFEPVLVGIGKSGRWHRQSEAWLEQQSDPRTARIDETGAPVSLDPMPPEAVGWRLSGSDEPVDFAFPVLHGPQGEDGCVQGLFELAGIPYAGAGVASSAVGMDKVMQKQVLAQLDLPVVRYHAFTAHEWQTERQEQLDACAALGFPVFVKPANLGSSLGVGKARDGAELERAIAAALAYDTKILVERGLAAPREIECSVLGHGDARVSLPGEIVVRHADGFYSYDAKYLDDGAELRVPAALHYTETKAVQLMALRVFRALDASGLARVDLFLADGELYVNEINTMPGFTAISMYPRLWEASGVSAQQLVSAIIDAGLARHAERSKLRVSR